MHTPPYSLKQRRRPQFPMPTDPRRRCRQRPTWDRQLVPTYAAAPVTPREPMFTKGEKTCPDSRPTRMQNFTLLAFSVTEKSIIVQKQTKKQRITHSKLSTPP